MKNTLSDLNNYLFESIERLNDDSLSDEELEKEIKRSEAVPVYYKMNAKGKEKIITPNGVVITCDIVNDPNIATGIGYIPHWSNCPKSDTFRKKNSG